jgi:hypothetical protein
MKKFVQTQDRGLVATILHEAAHNLGPAHEYKYKGKTDDQIFGGPLASTVEELKAQTAALWYVDYLLKKGVIDEPFALESYVNNLVWAMGHISRGMYTADNKPMPYSQLAAIQVGFLLDEGAMSWNADVLAANGKDKGAFAIHFEKMPAAVDKMMKIVGQLKAKGQKATALELQLKYVDSDKVPQAIVAERFLRFSKANFVYGLSL